MESVSPGRAEERGKHFRGTRPLLIVDGKGGQIKATRENIGRAETSPQRTYKGHSAMRPWCFLCVLRAFVVNLELELLQGFLFVAANDKELVQFGNFEDFADLRID